MLLFSRLFCDTDCLHCRFPPPLIFLKNSAWISLLQNIYLNIIEVPHGPYAGLGAVGGNKHETGSSFKDLTLPFLRQD